MDDKDKQKLIEENEKLKKENARLKEILEGKKIKEINIKLKKENENYSINRTATAFPKMRTMRVSPSPPISIGA